MADTPRPPLEYERNLDSIATLPKRRRLGSIVFNAVVVGSLLLLGSVLLPARHGNNNPARCMSNLRQIGLAMKMYANDHGGEYPPDLETTLLTQDLTSDVFVCPSSNDERATGPTPGALAWDFRKPGHCSYVQAIPANVRERDLTPEHVLVYEKPGNHSGGGMNVLFGDGRAEWLGPGAAARLVAELHAGFNPPRPGK